MTQYRMRLTYDEPSHAGGKTSEDADEVAVRFVKLVGDRRIDPALAREGLRVLQDLGATRTAAFASARLRDRGVRGLPRGPRLATLGNPAGLTRRQAEVLGLLARGMSNQRIASRLRISPKTVEHHVSAVLSKLEVGSRTEAALRATELGLPDPVREHL